MTSSPEVLSGGPEDDGPTPGHGRALPSTRTVAVVAALLGLVVGVAATQLVTGAQSASPSPHPSDSAAAGDAGAVVPEVVDAETLPGTGGLEVVAPSVKGASTPGSLRYDYRLEGAIWLAPDGTIRTGRPVCFRGSIDVDVPQQLQVAVVHARAVDGGPNVDRVVWYRCAPAFPTDESSASASSAPSG